jgi:hypothetical protein
MRKAFNCQPADEHWQALTLWGCHDAFFAPGEQQAS